MLALLLFSLTKTTPQLCLVFGLLYSSKSPTLVRHLHQGNNRLKGLVRSSLLAGRGCLNAR